MAGLYERATLAIKGLGRPRHAAEQAQSDIQQVASEPIRLVIWDLDETFWRGTLTEGGIEYVQANQDTVIELARRGIMSSICSRNDHGTIEALLRKHDIWDYFVFPSIAWSSKGPRLKNIMENSQLRAPTILFIDDNPMNRAEAKRFVDGINVYDPADMGNLLDNPLFKGKEDVRLTRLAQYKLLERRTKDMNVAGDNNAFLRESDIKVYIDHDVESNLDRSIELINRTNQLNFTKTRLPEDQARARSQLLELLNITEVQAGLVRVVDRYGDYGYCGLYVQYRWLHNPKSKLIHFCFSCRTLGMEVETWLYRRLGRPELEIQGDVLTDIANSQSSIDWIQLGTDLVEESTATKSFKIPKIFIRGGCETVAISHYFEILTDNLISEFAFLRNGVDVRIDHSLMLKLALEKPDTEVMKSLLALGFQRSDFETAFLNHSIDDERSVYILGMWPDANDTVFRHTKLGFKILMYLNQKIGALTSDLLSVDIERLPETAKEPWVVRALEELQSNYEFEGCAGGETTRQNVSSAIRMLPQNSLVFLIGCTERTMDSEGVLHDYNAHIDLNNALRACAQEFEQAIYVSIDEHILQSGDRFGPHNRYSREVYFRLYSTIRSKIEEWMLVEATKAVETM